LQSLSAIAAISAADAARFTALGATAPLVLGNLKFDLTPPPAQLALGQVFRTRIGPRTVFLCASTRAGEEALILQAWQKVGAGRTALLVIVPRHPQRFAEVAQLVTAHGLQLARRSSLGDAPLPATTQVWLGDSMGELCAYYAAADVAFIGGSLLPYGAQNLIEACAIGTPVLLGPSTFNFAAAADGALAAGAAAQVADADSLVTSGLALLVDDAGRAVMSAAGRAFAAEHRGATARTLALIEPYLRPD
jgi:3-deoxy-D-manno-octulosonic-acid transferase